MARTIPTREVRLYDFTNFRAFLDQDFLNRKKRNPAWSYQAWALRLGLKNNTSLLKVIRGQREAGAKVTSKLVQFYKFTPAERTYFEDLVKLSKLKHDPELSLLVVEKIKRYHPSAAVRFLDDQEFLAISRWWYYAIRQLTKLPHFKHDPAWIQKRLRFDVSLPEIARSIRTLAELGLLRKEEGTGRWVATPVSLQTGTDTANHAIRSFHRETLGNAVRALSSVDVREREFTGQTIAIRTEDLPQAKQMIRDFQARFCERFEKPDQEGNSVYQLHNLLFPLTQLEKENS